MYLVGIDVGTTGVKTLLISLDGSRAFESTKTYPIYSPHTNWFEQNPEDWWKAAVESIKETILKSRIDTSLIKGIGLSGQYHGLVILDRDSRVLRPAILWNDQRTASQSEWVISKVGMRKLNDIALANGAPYFTACKLLWVREHEPRLYERVRKMMLPKDYIRFKLTGEFATDVSDASGTLFLDVKKRKWSPELAALIGVDSDVLPLLYESPDRTGEVSRIASYETGLKAGIPVAGGAGDQAAAAIGNGIVEEGLLTYSIGTSGVIYAAIDKPLMDLRGRVNSFCHAVPGTWCFLACINSAAASLQWFQEKFAEYDQQCAEQRGVSVYSILEEKAAQIQPGSGRLFFLPYLTGERHPHTDPDARGVFFGLHSGHTRYHALRAVLEGVAYSFRDCLEVMKELGISIREIRATGGGAKSELWLKIQASVSGEPIVTMGADQGGAAFGAAILGGVCGGVFNSVKEACDKLVKTADRIKPHDKEKELYEKYFRFFQTLYPLLKISYRELASL